MALNELRRHHPQLTVSQHIAPGYTIVSLPQSFDILTQPWRHRLPIYLHHLFPIHATIVLDAANPNWQQLQEVVRQLAPADITIQVRCVVETRLKVSEADIYRLLGRPPKVDCSHIPTGRILSILVTQNLEGIVVYLGISWATQNISPWAGGQIPITEPVSNRAGYKLLEALDAFSLRLRPGDLALDLGAAPGAWTTILRRRSLCVTTVAPAPLYPWLVLDEGVTHYSMLAEEYLGQCRTTFDLIVNDMKLDTQDSARLMVSYAAHLRPQGIAIMTLKLRDRNRRRITDHTLRILRQAYKIIRIRQLVSNRNEVTLYLRRKT
jgi:23S rRNA (cytidine2498-2'-O)-methyltransferase